CFDFMLLERPIVFFDYDRRDYESNMGGFVYDYEQFAIGQRVKTQNELIKALQNDMGFNYDALNEKLNDHIDCKSTTRICKEICE
ncbi:MAG: CDP-glycerol glycerophosphotransferase family protein, partial [Thermotogota bacterium]